MELFFMCTGVEKDTMVVDTYMNTEIKNRKIEISPV